MVVNPAGQFQMGCKDKLLQQWMCSEIEQPAHEVGMRVPFAMSQFEVTFADWEACVAAGGCGNYMPRDQGWGRGNRPVISVSWEDAQSYVSWLSIQTGEQYRLPSEAEWEYATRAGTDAQHSWKRDFLEDYPSNCTECLNDWSEKSKTAPVGSFGANPFGLHDVYGNVSEWTQDCKNESYVGAPSDGSAWLTGNCESRALRGGSYSGGLYSLRSATRDFDSPRKRYIDVGFRVARSLSP